VTAGDGSRDPGAAGPRGGAERIGAYLARQRRMRGIDLEELARDTRIPLRSLQRLEAGAFDFDPDGFARGFVRTVAIALGLPPDETIARMLPEVAPDEEARPGRSLVPLLALLLAGVALSVALGAASLWVARGAPRVLAPVFQAREDGLVVRRDAVRALAEAQGLLGGTSGRGPAAGILEPVPGPRHPGLAAPKTGPPPAPDAAAPSAAPSRAGGH
jgi:hypothetical protein